jgi:hypothetical protein
LDDALDSREGIQVVELEHDHQHDAQGNGNSDQHHHQHHHQHRAQGSERSRLRRIEVITGRERRRRWSLEEKAKITAESLEPGAFLAKKRARKFPE